MKKYDEMPAGWRVDNSFGSPAYGCISISNGKNMLAGGEKGLLTLDEAEIKRIKDKFMNKNK
jgi:hypothetical protein